MFKFSKIGKNRHYAKNKKRTADRLARLRAQFIEAAPVSIPEPAAVALEVRAPDIEENHEVAGDWQEGVELCEAEPEDGARFELDLATNLEAVRAEEEQHRVLLSVHNEADIDVGNEELDGAPKRALDVNDISQFFVSLQARRDVPKAVMADIVKYMRQNGADVSRVLGEGQLPSFKSMRLRVEKFIPKISVAVTALDGNGERVELAPRSTYPKTIIRNRDLTVQYTLFYVSLKDVWEWHVRAHPKKTPNQLSRQFDMSLDGVPESRSSGLSIDIVSIRFINCSNIYSVAILQPARKRLGNKDAIVLKPFLDDLAESGLTVRYVIGDAPKRASMQGLKSHAAKAGCPYCYAKKTTGYYPASTVNARRRTDEELRERAQAIADGHPAEEDDGIREPSLLRNIPDFDLIHHVPSESMHLMFLGVVRKMLKLMYKQVGVTNKFARYRAEFRPVSLEPLNRELARAKGLSRFSRRPRDFDSAVYKAEEYRNLVLAFWPAVLKTCPLGTRQAWLRTVYCARACSLPNDLYDNLKAETDYGARDLRKWYIEFEEAFGLEACSHNVHVFHHLDLVRALGPLSKTSASKYEDHYALVKTSYKPGTMSKGKQALESLYLAQASGHFCAKRRKVRMAVTSKIDDRYVYLRDGRMIVLTEVGPRGRIVGRRVPLKNVDGVLEEGDLADVLVFRANADVSDESVTARASDVLGIVVFCDEFASVMTWSMLEM